VSVDVSNNFSGAELQVTSDISSSEQIVQQSASVGDVKAEDVTQDSETASEFSRSDGVVLVVIETEENSSDQFVSFDGTSQSRFDLLDSSGELGEVTVEEAVVVVEEFQVEGDEESETSQVDVVRLVLFPSGDEPSGGNNFSTGGFTEQEIDEATVSLGEFELGKLTVLDDITGSKEAGDDGVLVVLTLNDVFQVVLVNDTTFLGSDELFDVNAETS